MSLNTEKSIFGLESFILRINKAQKVDHLNCIKDAYNDNDISRIDIFTLNHDLIKENNLQLKVIYFH